MPNRSVCAAIAVFWIIANLALIQKDLMPRWVIGDPPDLSGLAQAEAAPPASRWSILVPDPRNAEAYRQVGKLITRGDRSPDGGLIMASEVQLDAGQLLSKTLFESRGPTQLNIDSVSTIDRDGALESFIVEVTAEESLAKPILTMEGQRKGDVLEVMAHGLDGAVEIRKTFPFSRGAVVQNGFNPLEKLQGLQVGQIWRTQVVSPLTGAIQTAKTEVASRQIIRWRSRLIEALEIVSHVSPFRARTWIRADDGLVIRQEIPTPLVTFILEREDDPADPPSERP